MDEIRVLQKRFDKTGLLISEWLRTVNSELTQETYGKVLKRNQVPGLVVLMKMAGELGCTPEEIKQMLMARGETVLARLIAPSAITREEQVVLEKYRALKGDPKKTKLVMDLLESLA